MNGEIAELCALTACARSALKRGGKPKYSPAKYINSEQFVFRTRENRLFSAIGTLTERTPEKWFKRLCSLGLSDKFMLPEMQRKI